MNKQAQRNQDIQFFKIRQKIESNDLINQPLSLQQAKYLISKSTQIFKKQPIVLNLSAPLKIIGDLYGHYTQTIKILEICKYSGQNNFLFLGNYVGKGQNSLQTLFTLLFNKIRFPLNTFLLRGKHQIAQNNRIFGFYKECQKKYGLQLWILINEMFTYLALCAVIQNQIFCSSSGLSSQIHSIKQIQMIQRPLSINKQQFIYEIVASKFNNCGGIHHQLFNEQNIIQWNKTNKFNLIVCSNQILQNGFQFYAKNQFLSLCSIPNLLGLGNLGAIFCVQQNLNCTFIIIKMPTKNDK